MVLYEHMSQSAVFTFLVYQTMVILFIYENLLILHKFVPAIQSRLLTYANNPYGIETC